MNGIFILGFLVSLILWVVFLIKPDVLNRIFKQTLSRKKISAIFGSTAFLLFILIGITAEPIVKENTEEADITAQQENTTKEVEIDKKQVAVATAATSTPDMIKVFFQEPVSTNTQMLEPQKNTVVKQPEVKPTTEQTKTAPVQSNNVFKVTQVVDGDTIKVDYNGKIETVRFIGVDTPESVDPRKSVECFGKEAANKTKEWLYGKNVRLESDSTQGERDKYSRLLRYIYLEDNTFINKLLISEGFAHEYTYNIPYKYQTDFKAAENDARTNKMGFWADGACATPGQQPAIQPQPTQTSNTTTQDIQTTQPTSDGHTWYVSSHYSSKYYYCDTDPGWQSLSPKYLRSFSSEASLKASYPNHSLHQPC